MSNFFSNKINTCCDDEKEIKIINKVGELDCAEPYGSICFVLESCSLYIKTEECDDCDDVCGWVRQVELNENYNFPFDDFSYNHTTKQISLTINGEEKNISLLPLYTEINNKIKDLEDQITPISTEIDDIEDRLTVEELSDCSVIYDEANDLYSFYDKKGVLKESWCGGCDDKIFSKLNGNEDLYKDIIIDDI